MKRKLAVERIYKIADYQTLKLVDEISELPEGVVLNQKVVEKISELLMVNSDLNYQRYLKLQKSMSQYTDDIIMAELEAIKSTTLDEIKDLLTQKEEN